MLSVLFCGWPCLCACPVVWLMSAAVLLCRVVHGLCCICRAHLWSVVDAMCGCVASGVVFVSEWGCKCCYLVVVKSYSISSIGLLRSAFVTLIFKFCSRSDFLFVLVCNTSRNTPTVLRIPNQQITIKTPSHGIFQISQWYTYHIQQAQNKHKQILTEFCTNWTLNKKMGISWMYVVFITICWAN